jgi:hypothetical protein
MVKALDTNTGVVAIGYDGSGDVRVNSGLHLAAGDPVVFNFVGNLASIAENVPQDQLLVDNEVVKERCYDAIMT